jgi:hypothetical protein
MGISSNPCHCCPDISTNIKRQSSFKMIQTFLRLQCKYIFRHFESKLQSKSQTPHSNGTGCTPRSISQSCNDYTTSTMQGYTKHYHFGSSYKSKSDCFVNHATYSGSFDILSFWFLIHGKSAAMRLLRDAMFMARFRS